MRIDQINWVGHIVPQPGWGMPVHSHDYHEIVIVLDGHMVVTTADNYYEVGQGDILLYPAGQAHHEQADKTYPVETILLRLHRRCRHNGIICP